MAPSSIRRSYNTLIEPGRRRLLRIGTGSWLALPEERAERLLLRPDLVHGRGVVEDAFLHRVGDLLRLAYVRERVAVDDHEVGQLAGLQRAEVLAEAEGLGAAPGGRPQRLHRRHGAADGEGPHLPVGAEALELAVRA